MLLRVIMNGIIAMVLVLVGVLAVIIVFRPKAPAVMTSIIDTAKNADHSNLPAINRFTARDGQQLSYRFYAGANNKIAILMHGSSGSSLSMHALGKALSKHGITVFALDVRGHGDSGIRGDISYIGQLEDDLVDFVQFIRKDYPNAAMTLIGHSSGGGYALKVAGSSLSNLFNQYILLSPYLKYNSPTVRPDSGGWANASIPRIIGISILNSLGIHYFDGLPVVAFAVPDNITILTKTYSYRLLNNYKANDDYFEDFRNTTIPIAIIVGGDDEILYPEQFAQTIQYVNDKITVEVVPAVNHMAIVSNENAFEKVVRHF